MKQLSEDTISARRKANSTLISFCRGHSKLLLPLLNTLVERAEKLWQSNEILGEELILLYEAFVVVSNQMQDFEKQSNFLSYLLASAKNEWHSEPIQQVIKSEELLLKGIGILPEPNQDKQVALSNIVNRIIYILSLFHSISRRMPGVAPPRGGIMATDQGDGQRTYPISPYLMDILPSVLQLIQTLHTIYRPQNMSNVPQETREPLHIGPLERSQLLKENMDKSSFTQRDHIVWKMRTDIKSLRIYSYSILGQACKFCDVSQFWFNSQLLPMLTSSVFSDLEFMDDSDMDALLDKFIKPFIEHCPQQLYEQILPNTLQPLFMLIMNRLTTSWSALIDREKGIVNIGASEKDEVIQDRILRELTRMTISTIANIMQCIQKHKGSTDQAVTPLCHFILSHDDMLYVCLMLAIRLMTIPDDHALRRAVSFLYNVVVHPIVISRPKFYPVIGGEALQCAIRALMTFKEEAHPELISLVTAIFRNYNHRINLVRQIMLQVPNVTDVKFQQLVEETTVASEKECKNLVRKFLQHILGVQSGTFRKEPKTILNLPPMQQLEKRNLVDEIQTYDLGGLFESVG